MLLRDDASVPTIPSCPLVCHPRRDEPDLVDEAQPAHVADDAYGLEHHARWPSGCILTQRLAQAREYGGIVSLKANDTRCHGEPAAEREHRDRRPQPTQQA